MSNQILDEIEAARLFVKIAQPIARHFRLTREEADRVFEATFGEQKYSIRVCANLFTKRDRDYFEAPGATAGVVAETWILAPGRRYFERWSRERENNYWSPLPPVYIPGAEDRDERKADGRERRVYGHVYFLLNERLGAVKIGHAKYVKSRVSSIQTASPDPLVLLHSINAKNRVEAESALHHRFKKQRLSGEWFAYAGPLKEFIDKKPTGEYIKTRCQDPSRRRKPRKRAHYRAD